MKIHRVNKPQNTIPSSTYSEDYYLSDCDGFREFEKSKGRELPRRISKALELANIRPGDNVLDVGCGRGELVLHCSRQGAHAYGVDYSFEAIKLAQKIVDEKNSEKIVRGKIGYVLADSRMIPIHENYFDFVFMLDIVEHLNPDELKASLLDARRVLKHGGKLIIHTMPNLWYYQYGYPIYRLLQKLRGINSPQNPRERWRFSHVHINEQTPKRLNKLLKETTFRSKVWLASFRDYKEEKHLLIRLLMIVVTRIYPFKWFFCDDIVAIAQKPIKSL